MIKATEFHHEYLKQVNRINSDFNKSISVATRDSYFNRAMGTVLENLFAVAETNTTIRNHLRQLELKAVPLDFVKKTDNYVVYKYPDKFYRLLRQWCTMTTDTCSDPRRIMIRTIQSDDIEESLKDPYWEPSFEWEETFGEEAKEGYYIYKKKEHKISEVRVDYMFKPNPIAAPSLANGKYVNAKGEVVVNDQDFEVDSTYLWQKIVDIAVLYTLRDLGQLDDFNVKLNEILFSDKVYLK